MAVLNPYETADFATQIKSVSHVHPISVNPDLDQTLIDELHDLGYNHVPVSHYMPSAPYYPLADYCDVPSGMLSSPNSEKVQVRDGNANIGHYNTLGCFLTGYGQPSTGDVPGQWRDIFAQAFAQLQYADGGGITINHPDSNITIMFNRYCQMLDFDNRVLGLEVYNNMSERINGAGYCASTFIPMWDRILATGRRCWGFGALDWMGETYHPLYGSNMLCCASNERECLKAYRDGRFYVLVKDTGIRVTSISATAMRVKVSVNKSAHISFVTNNGRVSYTGKEANYSPKLTDVYVRCEIVDSADSDGIIYTQPIMMNKAKLSLMAPLMC